MDTSRFVRIAPLTGVVYFALTVAGVVTLGSTPDFAAEPREFTEYYTDEQGRVVLGSTLVMLGVFFLIWFLGSLAAASRRAEGGDGRVSRLAFGGGLVGATLFLAGMAANMMAALRIDEQGGISDDVAVVYGDLSTALGFIGGPYAFAVLLAGTALVNSRTRFLPRWLTWVSGLLALGMLVTFVAWAFVLALPFWVIVVGSLLFFADTNEEPIAPAG